MVKKFGWLLAAMGLTAFSSGWASDSNQVELTVTVTIQIPPCVINDNQPIDVNFGSNVFTTDVAAGTVKQDIVYSLDCSGADQMKKLKMKISGTGASFDSKLLKTNFDALAIELDANGSLYPLNTDLNFDSVADKPTLSALLVQQPGGHLPTGDFTASSTMTVSYQ